jgi:hypothetical protein
VRGKGHILPGAWAIPDSPVFALWLFASGIILPKLPSRDVFSIF